MMRFGVGAENSFRSARPERTSLLGKAGRIKCRSALGAVAALALLASCGEPPPRPAPPVIGPESSEPVVEVPAASPPPLVDVRVTAPTAADQNIIDAMESLSIWRVYKDASSEIRIDLVEGREGRALEMQYDMKQGKWVGIWRPTGVDLRDARGIRFAYRGEGSRNTLEFKLEDEKNTTFGRIFPTDAREWKVVEVPFSSLAFWWGQQTRLDYRNTKLHFAISQREGDLGGTGRLVIDRIEVIR